MSFDSSPLSTVRLHDLKLWQGSYDNLQRNKENTPIEATGREVNGMSFSPKRNQTNPEDWDRREISPAKPFEQLLEEKLAQDVPIKVVNQPKRPFLRKGQGLMRFRMKPNTELWRPPKKSNLSHRQSTEKNSSSNETKGQVEGVKTAKKSLKQNKINAKETQVVKKGILKKTNFSMGENKIKNKNDGQKRFNEEKRNTFDHNSHIEGIKNPVDLTDDYLKCLETSDQYHMENFERSRKPSFSDRLEQQLKELEIFDNNKHVNNVAPHKNEIQTLNSKNLDALHNFRKPHQDVDMTPLSIPDFVKPRGTWHNVLNQDGIENIIKNDKRSERVPVEEIDSININSEQDTTTSSSTIDILKQLDTEDLNGLLANKVNFLAMRHFLMSQGQHNMISNNIPGHVSEVSSPRDEPRELTNKPYVQDHSEKELRIFETLEKRTANSSFCSTNTSIVNLLSSTPQKNRFVGGSAQNAIPEDIPTPYSDEKCEDNSNQYVNIQQKLSEITKKTDFLQDFLMNLEKIEKGNGISRRHSDSVSSVRKRGNSESTLTSFSDEERWSTRSPSPARTFSPITATTFDSSYRSETSGKVDMAVNTSFDRLDETFKEGCSECEEFRSKLSQARKELDETNTENMRLKRTVRDLEKKQSRFDRDVKNAEKKHERDLVTLREELENERKKFAKEKMVFETYVKESQNRPNKKEREEITRLKQELADAKELIKLKEAKNGATQARLRTQIKHLEKEIAELQTTVEKLQRENAKLSANQKLNRPRPTEMKMLHEINKNISKLAEETLKKQPSNSSVEEDPTKVDKNATRRKSREKSVGKENEERKKVDTHKETRRKSLIEKKRKESSCSDNSTLDMSCFDSLSIEKQYENVFRHFDSPRANTSSTSEKIERTLENGAVEIRYGNGNIKTISPDANIVKVQYFNGDFKETNIKENLIRYHYAENDSWHTQYGDGTEVIEYADGQKSKKYKDGKIEMSYPDGTFRTIHTDGTDEETFPDGSKTIKKNDGEQIILLVNGQKEIHTENHKRREYPDGTVRTLYKDGTVETVYANGRVRVKDPNGVLIMDTYASVS